MCVLCFIKNIFSVEKWQLSLPRYMLLAKGGLNSLFLGAKNIFLSFIQDFYHIENVYACKK
jgi:hypothetical protein